MKKLIINGKFKEDFNSWIKKASLNYITSFEIIETYGYNDQIDFLMKFLHDKPYAPPYKDKDHGVYSIEQMNEIIEDYNYAKQ